MNIDQALTALCEKHDLTGLHVGPTIAPSGKVRFVAYAYWNHVTHGAARIGMEATASEAIAHAIQQVYEARACVVEVPAMELGEVVL